MKYQKYTVVSQAGMRFPLDMLQYDSSFPATQDDVAEIENSLTRDRGGMKREAVVVNLGRYAVNKEDKPASDRWASFGYTVYERVYGGGYVRVP